MSPCHVPIFGASYGRLAATLSRTAVGDEEPRMCAVMCRLCAQGWVEIKASPVHGKGLFTTRAVSANGTVLRESPLVFGTSGKSQTACWSMTEQLLLQHETLSDNSLLSHSALQWDANDTTTINNLVEHHGWNRSDIYAMYCKVASANVRIRGNDELFAIYKHVALMNHSCSANCIARYEGADVVVQALRAISKGEELFLNFIEVTADGELDGEQEQKVKEWRRESFHALYGFHCQCPLCIN
jgi:hypothetical protein